MSLFEIVHGYQPKKLVDLIPVPMHARVARSAKSFAQYVRSLHNEISKKNNVSNTT